LEKLNAEGFLNVFQDRVEVEAAELETTALDVEIEGIDQVAFFVDAFATVELAGTVAEIDVVAVEVVGDETAVFGASDQEVVIAISAGIEHKDGREENGKDGISREVFLHE
jgi:hypothetical protein